MVVAYEALRDWHRMFGMLLTDLFSDSPYAVEVERDMSMQQQLLDALIIRRGRGRFVGRLPDGMQGLRSHNLVTFKSRHEALDPWAMKELCGAYVAYRKSVSPTPRRLVPEVQFGLYAVSARFPHNLAGQVPWQQVQPGVYDCLWATDTVRVIVIGELPQEAHNAPLHLFSASRELVAFGGGAYRRRSAQTSRLLGQLFETLQGENFAVYTMEDFNRQYIKEHFGKLTPQEQNEVLERLPAEQRLAGMPPEQRLAGVPPEQRLAGIPPEQRLAGMSAEEIQHYLDQLTAQGSAGTRKRGRKKS